ncbi:MAG: hypothetical protein QXT86_12085 [Archaeoglobaceae archaeon]
MAQVIELKPGWYPFNFDEHFDQIAPVLYSHFDHGGAHLIIAPIRLMPNGVYVYCSHLSSHRVTDVLCADCVNSGSYERVNFRIEREIPDIFFDRRMRLDFCKAIIVNDRYAGEYCPRYNCLWLTDWSHDSECVEVALELLPKVFEALKVERKPIKELKFGGRVTIGVDAEFEEMSHWRLYTPIRTTLEEDLSGEIGTDGSGLQVEIRPRYAYSPKELVRNIKRLIERISFPISVLGHRYPLGSHIHIGLSEELIGYEDCFVKLLDEFLGKRLIELSGNARGDYKQLGAYRVKDWGFEYRTLPSAILLNPRIARIVFKIAKNTIEYLIKHERIELNGYREDLKRYAKLTDKEIDYFLAFIDNYWKTYDGRAINSYWTKKPIKAGLEILFYDDWDYETKKFVKEQFESKYWKTLLKGKRIVFYGLREDRGLVVAGFETKHAETIEHPVGHTADWQFGLPRHVRVLGILEREEMFKMLKDMIDAIKEQLKKDIRGGRKHVCNRV